MSMQPAPSQATTPPEPSRIDPLELRQVLSSFVTGVTVITTIDASGRRWGLTANSFTSLSLDPPLILWNQSTSAPSYPAFRGAEYFAVNILAHDQSDISRTFGGRSADKFASVAVKTGLGGVPLIDGCAAYIECTREARYWGGDHAVFIGRVKRIEKHARPTLVFGHGRYLVAQPHEYAESSPQPTGVMQSQLHALRVATPALVELAREFDRSMALSVWGSHGPTVVRWEQPANDPLKAQLPAGQVCRLLTSATGLAWAAFGSAAESARLIDEELSAPLEGAPTTSGEAAEILQQMRVHGLARVVGSAHYTGRYGTRINAAAAPVLDAEGRMVLAITIVGAADHTEVDWNGVRCQRLKSAAAHLSHQLGFRSAVGGPTRSAHHAPERTA
jgi:flavin reductase (DIM6/NTAB) family NADH-FMN oxidoreductase RutF/DNA-binding IclR family transcriptional regulator